MTAEKRELIIGQSSFFITPQSHGALDHSDYVL